MDKTGAGQGPRSHTGKKPRKPLSLELEIYHDPTLLGYEGWKIEPEPWLASTAMEYVSFPHFDRMWLERCHMQHCKSRDVKYNAIEDLEVKWRFLTILRAISNLERWPKNSIPRCIASMMYAERVLKKKVDWSTLRDGKFGHIGDALSVKRPIHIPEIAVPQWFIENPKLVDEPGQPLPADREAPRPRWKPHVHRNNDIVDTTSREQYVARDMHVAIDIATPSVGDVQSNFKNGIQNTSVSSFVGEQRGQLEVHDGDSSMDVDVHTTITAITESRKDSTASSSAQPAPQDMAGLMAQIVELRVANAILQVEKNVALEKVNAHDSHVEDLQKAHKLLLQEMDAMTIDANKAEAQQHEFIEKIVDMEIELKEATARGEVVVEITEELQATNNRLENYLEEALKERKAMRLDAIMAVARARQYESEFQSILDEWNANGRLWTLLLTSWPSDETMFPIAWTTAEPSLYCADGTCFDWKKIDHEDHHWDVNQLHEKPSPSVGAKLWSTPHPMVSDSSSCSICSSPFGPEGCYVLGTCGHSYHPPCLIKTMIQSRSCYCRAPFHPRLYLQFNLKHCMPSHWIYRQQDFDFHVEEEYNGQNMEWNWKYDMSKLQLYIENMDNGWVDDAEKILYAANELYPNKPIDHTLKLFFYQTLGWHWDRRIGKLITGIKKPFYNSHGDLAITTATIQDGYEGLGEDFEQRTEKKDLSFEQKYHRHRLGLAALDAISLRVSPETKNWLDGGSKPKRQVVLSPTSRRHQTRATCRAIAQAQASSTYTTPLGNEGRQWIVEIADSDSDS